VPFSDEDYIRASQRERASLTGPTWEDRVAESVNNEDSATRSALDALRGIAPALDRGNGPLAQWAENWDEFWATDHKAEQFMCAPILAANRSHALYATAKTGKSLLTLEMVTAIALGRPWMSMPAQSPRRVLYLDMEMGPSDLFERLVSFNIGPSSALDNLRYVRMPAIGPLDTERGGKAVFDDAMLWGADLVVVDTTARSLQGEENSAETINEMFRYTLMPLKEQGVTTLRLDHAGKSGTMRGTSAKADDVDVVWALRANDDDDSLFDLEATHRRVSWIPQHVNIRRHKHAPVHRPALQPDYILPLTPAQKAVSETMDMVGVPTAGVTRQQMSDNHIIEVSSADLEQIQQYRHEASIEAAYRLDSKGIFR